MLQPAIGKWNHDGQKSVQGPIGGRLTFLGASTVADCIKITILTNCTGIGNTFHICTKIPSEILVGVCAYN